MKRNLDLKVLDLDGEEFKPPLTLEEVCYQAVFGVASDGSDNSMTVEKKLQLHKLGKKVHKGGVQDFTAEEITLLKERIGKSFYTLAVGQVFELLEQDWIEPTPTSTDGPADTAQA